ncbi:MAG: YbaN family protein [Alistipes sp.]|nr:YbaN family protein [Alistipes sp.]
MKIILTILGLLSLGLAVAGIFLPLLPTTPLLLLSAWCFVRSSERLYEWLIYNRYLGEYIRNFREYKAIPIRAKVVSVVLIWLTLGYCVVAVVAEYWWAQVALLLLASAITWHILSYATLRK